MKIAESALNKEFFKKKYGIGLYVVLHCDNNLEDKLTSVK